MSNSHFKRGSGCYTCKICGRRTRATGNNDNEFVDLCIECYEKAGDENAVSDGHMTQEQFDAKWASHESDQAAADDGPYGRII